VFENRAMRRKFGLKTMELIEVWINFHNDELNDLYASLNITRVIKSRKVRWSEHVARIEVM
jgi:hypothetical protein